MSVLTIAGSVALGGLSLPSLSALARASAVGAILVSTPTGNACAAVRCDIRTKHECSSAGCHPVTPSTFNLIDAGAATYARCDAKGCDEYAAVQSRSGDFVNIAVPERGLLAKLSLGDGSFVEVATSGTVVLTSFGTCAPAR